MQLLDVGKLVYQKQLFLEHILKLIRKNLEQFLACEAIPILPPFKVDIAKAKPNPSAPILFSFGTFTSLNNKVCVSEPRIPIFFSFGPTSKPGIPFSTIRTLIPL